VAQTIVDGLEMVDIQHQQRERQRCALCGQQLALGLQVPGAAVLQLAQGVGGGVQPVLSCQLIRL